MKREIKFRAWNGGNMQYDFNPSPFTFCTHGAVCMQYTGLKDKNGKEIYEGDVVKPFSDEDYAEIIFMDGAFKVATKTKKGSYLIWNYLKTEIEVVGNIHEDKDLLK